MQEVKQLKTNKQHGPRERGLKMMPVPTCRAGRSRAGEWPECTSEGETCAHHPASPLLQKGSIRAPQLGHSLSRIPWTQIPGFPECFVLNICMYSCQGGGIVASEMMVFSSYCPFLTTMLGGLTMVHLGFL